MRAGSKPSSDPAPAREALRAAIERHGAAAEQVARLEAAIQRAEARKYDAAAVVRSCEAALNEAREGEASELARAVLDDRSFGASAIKAAEANLAVADEQLGALRKAEGTLRGHLLTAQAELEFAQRRLRPAACAVLSTSSAIAPLLERLELAMQSLVALGDETMWLTRNDVLKPAGDRYDPTTTDDLSITVRRLINRLTMAPTQWTELIREAGDGWARWRDALEALQADSGAPLPGE